MEKSFISDFYKLKNYLENNINFSFSRFSDGELFVLQNKRLELNNDHYVIGDVVGGGRYSEEEQKTFIPEKHEFFRKKLEDCLKYKDEKFYRGICTRPDVNIETFNWMVELAGGDCETLTWSNLLINGNYARYIEEIVPIFKTKKVIMVVNEKANLTELTFNVIHDFRVGTNCFINDYGIVEKICEYIKENNIKDYIFLISCASLSNLIIHELHKLSRENTYIDIGSTLNPLIGLSGCMSSRNYLREYWMKENGFYLNMVCEWN